VTSYDTDLTALKIVLYARQKCKTLFMNGKIFIKSSKERWRLVIVFTYLFHIVCYFNVLSLDLCLLTIGEGIYVRRLLSWHMPLVEQELLTLPEHLNLPPAFSGVHVTQSLVLCVCFLDRCFFFCPFSFGRYVVCSSLLFRFWLPLWYLQTLLCMFLLINNCYKIDIF